MQHEELTGIVERIIFQNSENGFTVFAISLKNKQEIIVNGTVPALHPGERVSIQGTWFMHPKFGKQLNASQCTISLPTSLVGIKKYLASGMIKGIGPVYADKLVDAFGERVLEIIDQQPYRLHEIAGIGPKRVERIISAWQDQKEISHIMVFLQERKISPAYATKIYKRYGRESLTVVQENPYRLADDIWGIGFKIADQIAQNMGIAPDSLKRISSGILYALSTLVGLGHLYAELEALRKKTIELLELQANEATEHTIKLALHDLYNNGRVKLITHNELHYLTLSSHYFSEKGVAGKLKTLLEHRPRHTFDVNSIYNELRTSSDAISLNEDQQHGIITALSSKVTVITGGPGTGKTTLIKKLLTVLEKHHVRYKLAAPTGRAAKRITEGTGRHAATLHRLLEFDVSTMSFTHNEQRALPLDFLIIDEASMIDIFLAHAVLKAMPLDAHLVLIGDVNQLPSVGAGNFLNDVIQSNVVPCIRLTKIFRQAQDSLIIVNAHRINNGEFPTMSVENSKRDFIFIKEDDPQTVAEHLAYIYKTGLPKYGIPAHESIVLVPMNRGIVGTYAINHQLQTILNPTQTPAQIMRSGTTFKVGDRVMQIRNNYDKLVFNGDIGTIEEIQIDDQTITVNFIDQRVIYENSELDELVLAYAVSIHKSQGSEYSAVIVPIFMQHFMLLQRNLIYTAITRAKKLCIFLGQSKAIAMALRNTKGLERTTFLQQYLTSDLQCR